MTLALNAPDIPSEILLEILGNLRDDRDALCRIVLVCKIWADLGTELLWHDAPEDAFQLVSSDRKQYYADKVQELAVSSPVSLHLEGLAFPRLRHLRVSPNSHRIPEGESLPFEHYAQLLMPQLKSLHVRSGRGRCHFLSYIPLKCHSLQQLRIYGSSNYLVGDDLLRCLEQLQDLHTLCLSWDDRVYSFPSGNELVIHLAQRRKLVMLEIDYSITLGSLKLLVPRAEPLFCDLQSLEIMLDSNAVSTLAQLMPGLVELKLTLKTCESTSFLIGIGTHLTNLRGLSIAFHIVRKLQKREIVCLGSLTSLRRLSLTYDHTLNYDIVIAMELDESLAELDFKLLFSNLSQLREFVFHANTDLTFDILRMLGKHCRNLMYCAVLMKEFELLTLMLEPVVLFPNLKGLEIGNCLFKERLGDFATQPLTVTAILAHLMDMTLKHHAPKLEDLACALIPSEVSRALTTSFEARTRPSSPLPSWRYWPKLSLLDNL
ncbi:hypothetical protein K470DRAFT_260216 [Piedraia hortae CBS 480.64]|uniref:F-box domain-containing protein n=1 Tax=Piedraia hortae CBS 480.64 TaxID=1314780 RepID=A0A6A7BSC4_9PEZI|nr:hypothetical protein K470DRAFT_260216 [Piedraia hortae CBS 480.64]